MKTTRLLLILVFASSICSAKGTEVTIVGTVKGTTVNNIVYKYRSNSIIDVVLLDSKGAFRISLPVDKTSFITLLIPDVISGTVIVEPGENYVVNFDLTKESGRFAVIGKNEAGINYYNNNSIELYAELRKYKTDTSSSIIRAKLSDNKKNVLSVYNGLLETGKVSPEFYRWIEKDMDCFYAVLAFEICQRTLRNEGSRGTKLFKDLLNLRNEVLTEYPPTQLTYFNSPQWYYYSTNFLWSKMGLSYVELNKMSYIDHHLYYIKEAEKIYEGKMLENFVSEYLNYWEEIQFFNENYEEGFLTLFEDFKKRYPKSSYIHFFEPYVKKILELQQINTNSQIQEARFLPNPAEQTLKGILGELKGQPLFIDMWASWCSPCRREFTIMDPSVPLLFKEKGIQVLYISIDLDEKDEQWRKLIRFYKLNGAHIRANKKLKHELDSVINNGKPYGIPKYLIVDKEGRIINNNAPRPSDLVNLKQALSSISK